MARNLVIFSDGTGQQGGLFFDERRSNIYKLYRASRCGPDSTINPAEQLTYYDPGLGTTPGAVVRWWRKLYNVICQATGLGVTRNIIDCYTYIIQNWRPGDRIFLFGFSRGAYTVRCLATVLTKCGVPTQLADDTRNYRGPKAARAIATKAVRNVYQYVLSSCEPKEYVERREELAAAFRERYGSDNGGKSNALPHFIGVFDTVAALGTREFVATALAGALLLFLAISGALWFFTGEFWRWFVGPFFGTAIVVGVIYGLAHTKFARGLQAQPLWRTFHWAPARSTYYDESLTIDIPFARHALSIDENRASFDRVPWGEKYVWRKGWLEQVWFAGNHSDIGGSYAENESRLSDIALGWMVDEAKVAGIKIDDTVLRIFPSADGIEHDECKSSIFFRFAQRADRPLVDSARLHPTVIERLALSEVMNYSTSAPYRPAALRTHVECMHFYDADDLIAAFGAGAAAEARRRAAEPSDEQNKNPEGYWDRLIAEIERRAPIS